MNVSNCTQDILVCYGVTGDMKGAEDYGMHGTWELYDCNSWKDERHKCMITKDTL